MLLAALVRYERLTVAKSLGVLATIVGVGFALGEKLIVLGQGADGWLGELAVFLSALVGAVCSVFYRPYLRRYPALPVSALAMFASELFLAALAAGEGFFRTVPAFTPLGWFAVLFIGVSSGVGYYLWLWALKHATPTKVSVFLSLSPITATALGGLVLAEPISGLFLIGLLFVVLGLWLAHRRPEGATVD